MAEQEEWPDPSELITYEMGLQDCIRDQVITDEQADAYLYRFIHSKFGRVFEYFMGDGTD